MRIEYNDVVYSFPDEALTGTQAPVTEAMVQRTAGSAAGACGCGSGTAALTYRIYAQRRQGSRYLAAHGCSLCALSALIGAVADPSVTAASLEKSRNALLGLRLLKLSGPLARSARMPLNIAGAYRILQLFMDGEYLDIGAEKDPAADQQIRTFITDRASRGIPVLATGRSIPSLSGSPLCPGKIHSFLIIGMKDPSTLIVADSAGLNDERIKFVDIDTVVSGVLRSGVRAALKKGQYYYNRFHDGGLLSPREF